MQSKPILHPMCEMALLLISSTISVKLISTAHRICHLTSNSPYTSLYGPSLVNETAIFFGDPSLYSFIFYSVFPHCESLYSFIYLLLCFAYLYYSTVLVPFIPLCSQPLFGDSIVFVRWYFSLRCFVLLSIVHWNVSICL